MTMTKRTNEDDGKDEAKKQGRYDNEEIVDAE